MIAYIIACYFGKRRVHDPYYEADPLHYLKQQVNALITLESDIAHVSIMINKSSNDPSMSEVIDIISPLSNKQFNCNISFRENVGMSYGAWHEGINNLYNKNIKYAFLIEDDYIPVVDNFDDHFLAEMTGTENVKYVCSLYRWGHAAITNGLVDLDAVKEIGGIPYPQSSAYGDVEQNGQVALSKAFEEHEFIVLDISEKASVPFLDANGGIVNYGNQELARVISPVILERDGNYTPVQS
jgi:hypothetical protein